MSYPGPCARFEFGPIRESWGLWREREWAHGIGLDDAGAIARRVVASGPPLGVTWHHPGQIDEVTKAFWGRAEVRQSPVVTAPADFLERLARAVAESNTPERIAAQNLQCRMAARYPTWATRMSLFGVDR